MNTAAQDFTYALRSLKRSPGYTLAAALLLTIGVGATTAIFSIVYAVILRPLPYPEPRALVQLVRLGGASDLNSAELTVARDRAASFSSIAGFAPGNPRQLEVAGEIETLETLRATPGLLQTLGVAPQLGSDLPTEPSARSVLISRALWKRSLGGGASILGRSITLDNVDYTVAGVLPDAFWFPIPFDVLLPLPLGDAGANTTVIARLKPGISAQQATAELSTLTPGIREASPVALPDSYRGLAATSFHEQVTGPRLRANLQLLLGATGVLLLIACSNLSNLTLTRAVSRQREIAIRKALGSSTARISVQFLLEGLLLSVVGALGALLAGSWLIRGLLAIVPFALPSAQPIELNRAAWAFAFALVLLANLTAAMAPLFAAGKLNLSDALKRSAQAISTPRRFRSLLVTGQVAASAILLVSAVLLAQSLYRLGQERLGFNPDGLIRFNTPVALNRQSNPNALRAFHQQLEDRLRQTPGVLGVGATNVLPLTNQNNFPAQREAHPEQSIGAMEIRQVTDGYLETMGMRILRGRGFNAQDTASSQPVILVSESVARAWWGQEDPVGDRVAIGRFRGRTLAETPVRTIVGVVADTKARSLSDPPRTTVYVPVRQADPQNMAWVVRGSASPAELREVVRSLDPRQRVDRLESMNALVARSTADPRFNLWLSGGLATVALLLTLIGLYGLLAYSVAQRQHEIGTRMALGAAPGQILSQILREGGTLIASGVGLGLLGAAYVSSLLTSLLFGIQPTDWSSYAITAATLLVTGLLACWIPARRAARLDPSLALRRDT